MESDNKVGGYDLDIIESDIRKAMILHVRALRNERKPLLARDAVLRERQSVRSRVPDPLPRLASGIRRGSGAGEETVALRKIDCDEQAPYMSRTGSRTGLFGKGR